MVGRRLEDLRYHHPRVQGHSAQSGLGAECKRIEIRPRQDNHGPGDYLRRWRTWQSGRLPLAALA